MFISWFGSGCSAPVRHQVDVEPTPLEEVLGDVSVAVDNDAVLHEARTAPTTTTPRTPDVVVAATTPRFTDEQFFFVGDSTMVAPAARFGHGSAYSGLGYELAPFAGNAMLNPFDPIPDSFAGTVVLAVSIWDGAATNVDRYVEALEYYQSFGHRVVVVEVPTWYGPDTSDQTRSEMIRLNGLVRDATRCTLIDESVRHVATVGGDDWVHPSENGVDELLNNLRSLDLNTYAC